MSTFLLKIVYASIIFSLYTGSVLGSKGGEVKCIERERQALLVFKQGLNDDGGMLSTWRDDGNGDCCKWRGVQCANETGHVQILDLRASDDETNYLSGEINPSLVELQHITYLDLSSHYLLTGRILEFIGSFNNLVYLNLSNCRFVGSIPYQLGKLSHLRYLDLSWNFHVNGVIPYQLGKLSHLRYLDLSRNSVNGIIPYQLGKLSHLRYLDLSWNFHVNGVIPYQLGNLSQLQHLLLQANNLSGVIPYQLGNLSLLQSLRLGWNYNLKIYEKNHGGAEWLSNLSFLNTLDLDGLPYLNNSHQWLQKLGKLPNLRELRLSDCSLSDVDIFPLFDSYLNFSTSLTILDLSYNLLTSSTSQWVLNFSSNLQELYLSNCSLSNNNLFLPSPSYFSFSPSLFIIDLSDNNLTSSTFSSLFNLSFNLQKLHLRRCDLSDVNLIPSFPYLNSFSSLSTLDLSENKLKSSTIFHWIFNFSSNLSELYISDNLLEGPIPDDFGNIMNSLKELDLSSNNLKSQIPNSIGNLCALQKLDLSNNHLSGMIPNLSNLSSLDILSLYNNQLNGDISKSIIFLPELEILYLDRNLLKGVLTESHFMKLSKLKELYLSYSSLILRFRTTWIPPFQLVFLGLASCKLGPSFPSWLQTQNHLRYLDISNAEISGSIPEWFWNASMLQEIYSINISHNNLVGEIPNFPLKLAHAPLIALDSNQLEGVIPSFLSQANALFLSKNKFSNMVQFLCANNTYEFLGILDISNNELTGNLPDCWTHLKSLEFIDLSNNKLSGRVPISMGSLVEMNALALRNNNLIGQLPSSLKSCSKLAMLDVGENKLSGPIPSWIGESLQQLLLLSLRANDLNGSIPLHLCYLRQIRVLDLSQNKLSEDIPTCLNNFTIIAQKSNGSDKYALHYWSSAFQRSRYHFHISLTWKCVEHVFNNPEVLLRIIDLSNNNLTGEIPLELSNLVGLISLNLSRNSLSGQIPSQIGNLKSLEVLDLSRNHLSGRIPPSLAQIYALSILNLSENRLYGEIPVGSQLQTFEAYSFDGNINLCGKPLDKVCPEDEAPTTPHASLGNEEDNGTSDFIKAFFMSTGLGFPLGFWGLLAPIFIKRSWRHAYLKLLNKLTDNIYVKG